MMQHAVAYAGDHCNRRRAPGHYHSRPPGAAAWGYTHIDALKAYAPAEVFLRMEDIVARLT
jgi:hypothetical protein